MPSRRRRGGVLEETVLRGRQVRLEPLRVAHAEELWPAASEPDIWRFMGYDVRTADDLRAWIQDRVAAQVAGTALPFVQRDARTGVAFGSSSLFDWDAAHRGVEIGHTWIGASHRRSAANTEAKLLLMTHAFERLGAIRVQLKTDDRNARSKAAIQRIGARPEGVLRSHRIMPDGFRRDSAYFSVLASEWPEVKARLVKMLDP